MLQRTVLSGRYYVKSKSKEVQELVDGGFVILHSEDGKLWLTATEKGVESCSKFFPPLSDLDEFELTIYNHIRLYMKGNKRCSHDDLWKNLLQNFPKKYRSIRNAVMYYSLTAIKSKI